MKLIKPAPKYLSYHRKNTFKCFLRHKYPPTGTCVSSLIELLDGKVKNKIIMSELASLPVQYVTIESTGSVAEPMKLARGYTWF